jgi:hypothetical protein
MVSLIELKIHSVMHLKITGLFPQYLSWLPWRYRMMGGCI